jgi:hypothetical protein
MEYAFCLSDFYKRVRKHNLTNDSILVKIYV